MITFAHLADTHIGSWRDEKMRQLSVAAFTKAVDICIQENVDFVLISGDFFDTSIPPIDKIKSAVTQFKRLKEKNISAYMISGSHDHSPSGKTMLDVLEEAGLFVNVVKGSVVDNKLRLVFTTDKKTGARITGMLGKRGTLEKRFYEHLDRGWLEQEIKKKLPTSDNQIPTANAQHPTPYHLFMFHSALNEFKPENAQAQESMPVSLLPRGFNYYAGGHVHMVFHRDESANGYGIITYPGPTFPCDFKEIEELKKGGMYIVQYDDVKTTAIWKPIEIVPVESIFVSCHRKSAEDVEKDLRSQLTVLEQANKLKNTIITIRLTGTLALGKLSDIHFNDIIEGLYHTGAFFVMKNTSAVTTPEFEEIQKRPEQTIDQIQESVIGEHLGQIPVEGMQKEEEKELTKKLLSVFAAEKNEGETTADFEKRILEHADETFKQFFLDATASTPTP